MKHNNKQQYLWAKAHLSVENVERSVSDHHHRRWSFSAVLSLEYYTQTIFIIQLAWFKISKKYFLHKKYKKTKQITVDKNTRNKRKRGVVVSRDIINERPWVNVGPYLVCFFKKKQFI